MQKPKTGKEIKFHYLVPASFKHKQSIKAIVLEVFRNERKVLKELNFVFCSDAYLLKLNKAYLGHDYYTDIITFDLSSKEDEISADVYISSDRVKDNARKLKIPQAEEYLRVIVHGALHLCGYRDKKVKDRQKMRKMEGKYLKMREKVNGIAKKTNRKDVW
jgi:probable rRNA maturation factor